MKFELDNLKSHLDPHFLFNNLNILSSLLVSIKEDRIFKLLKRKCGSR
ncbi:histidine kinase [Fulvivirga sp.]